MWSYSKGFFFVCKAEIQAALDKVCSYLPTQIKDQCTAFVNEYTDLVVKLTATGMSPEQVCSFLTLCSSGKMSDWGAFVKILPAKVKGMVLYFSSVNAKRWNYSQGDIFMIFRDVAVSWIYHLSNVFFDILRPTGQCICLLPCEFICSRIVIWSAKCENFCLRIQRHLQYY